MKKGQTSIEFLLLVAFSGLVFIVFFALIQERILEANYAQLNSEVEGLSEVIVSEIKTAERFGEGYSRVFWLPQDIRGVKYNVTTNGKSLTVKSLDTTFYYFFTTELIGNLTPGDNNITYVAGKIYVNQDLSQITQIVMDSNDADWEALRVLKGVIPIPDAPDDSYTEGSSNLNIYDFKSATIHNDNNYLYFKIEYYDPVISEVVQGAPTTNSVDLMIFFDTDLDGTTGYSNNDYSLPIVLQGAEYLFADNYISYENNNLSYTSNISSTTPYIFSGVSQNSFNFSRQQFSPNSEYSIIDSNTIEIKIPISKLSLVIGDSFGYTIISRNTNLGIYELVSDYIPGSNNELNGGIYTLT